MEQFLSRHRDKITGVLSGLDRILIRGTIRQLATVAGVASYLNYRGVLLKDFRDYAEATTTRIRVRAEQVAKCENRPFEYLRSGQIRKEEVARRYLERSPIEHGLICILSCLEPCTSYAIHRNRVANRLELHRESKKCLHLYFYFLHPTLGFLHARLQTWFPFTMHICLNGREWLSRQLDTAGIAYKRRDNCFPWIADPQRAQQLMDNQLRTNWRTLLDDIRQLAHPIHEEIAANAVLPYYWAVNQVEWATDLMFKDAHSLASLYPYLARHAITQFSSADVLRFLGRKLTTRFSGEATSDYGYRVEGLRVKHRLNANSVKIYDKHPTVLRVETTLHQPRDMMIYRPKYGEPNSPPKWRRLEKGVGAIHRMAEVAQKANDRYLDALAQIDDRTPLRQHLDRICRPTRFKGRRVRALAPWTPLDAQLLSAINRGEFTLTGFRNRDLRAILFPDSGANAHKDRSASARVSRLLRILRAHHIIRKLPKTHRYQLTQSGRRTVTAILAAHDAEVSTLLKIAA